MGKLNIAHHKSYHPYRRDNIEKVRRDEEEAKLKEEKEEGRMMLAVSSGRYVHEPFTNVTRFTGRRSAHRSSPRTSWGDRKKLKRRRANGGKTKMI